jgi:hypothetical protein
VFPRCSLIGCLVCYLENVRNRPAMKRQHPRYCKIYYTHTREALAPYQIMACRYSGTSSCHRATFFGNQDSIPVCRRMSNSMAIMISTVPPWHHLALELLPTRHWTNAPAGQPMIWMAGTKFKHCTIIIAT